VDAPGNEKGFLLFWLTCKYFQFKNLRCSKRRVGRNLNGDVRYNPQAGKRSNRRESRIEGDKVEEFYYWLGAQRLTRPAAR